MVKEVSRQEDAGAIAEIGKRLLREPACLERLAEAAREYALERDGGKPRLGGVAGSGRAEGIKCLHAHLAHYLARGTNPVGRMVHEKLHERGDATCGTGAGEMRRDGEICESCRF